MVISSWKSCFFEKIKNVFRVCILKDVPQVSCLIVLSQDTSWVGVGVLPLCSQCIFYSPSRLGKDMAVPDAFVEVVKVTNYNRLWDGKLTWYSPSVIHYICSNGLEHSLRIYDFRFTWSCLIIKILPTQMKFLEQSDDCTVDQLHFHLLHNKCFWFLWWHYGPVQICKALVLRLDKAVCIWHKAKNLEKGMNSTSLPTAKGK